MQINVEVGHFFTNIGEKHEVGTLFFICVGEKMFGWETFLKRVRSYCTLEHFFSFQHKYLLQYSKG